MDQLGRRFAFLAAFLCIVCPVTAETCMDVDSCRCKAGSFTVDLNPLSAAGAPNPRFQVPYGPITYYFTPCKALASPQGCTILASNISVCQESATELHDAGDFSTGKFAGDPAAGTLTYTLIGRDSGQERTSIFSLICSSENRLDFVSEQPILQYNFKLYTTQACLPETSKGLSIGSILVILFFVFFAVYWIAGFLFMKFVRRAEGVEMVPNYEFWKELPLLIRDGFVFTARGCKGETTYEKI